MLTSLALIFLVGLGAAAVFQKLGLPRIIGMILTGILLGPYALDLFDPSILSISAQLREMALVIILIKAGLSLDLRDLKKVGRPALMLAFLPASFELLAVVLFAPAVLGISRMEAAVLGSVLAAVSPAVVVPRMVQLLEERRGTGQGIPQMILAGASLDDVFVIVLFATCTGAAQSGVLHLRDLVSVPVSILLGIGLGSVTGWLLARFFESRHAGGHTVRSSGKVILLLGVAFMLLAVEDALVGAVPLSGLLAIMSMALVLAGKSVPAVTVRLQQKFGKLWLAAEVILFVLVGAAVDIRYTMEAGLGAVAVLAMGLVFRSAAVWLCVLGTELKARERLFCVISYLPKATVQAAIGSVPLSMGLPCGTLVLSAAVLAILITAPLGAIGMDRTSHVFLQQEPLPQDTGKS